jgi:hypothetical protein
MDFHTNLGETAGKNANAIEIPEASVITIASTCCKVKLTRLLNDAPKLTSKARQQLQGGIWTGHLSALRNRVLFQR